MTAGSGVPTPRPADAQPAQPSPARPSTVSRAQAIFLDFLERAGWSAGQVFYAALLAGGASVSVANLPWKYASVLALGAATASVVLTSIQYVTRLKPTGFWPDLLIRLVKTFLASLAASFAAAHPFNVTTFDWTSALNLAAVAVLTAPELGQFSASRNRRERRPGPD